MEASAKSVLILGASGTGKTFYAKAIAGNSSLPAFVINGKEADFHTEEFEHITFEDFYENPEEYANSLLIVDDVVRPSDYETKIINEILVKYKRHSNITVFVIAHALERNNLHSIIQHFDFVLFSNNVYNTAVFKVYSARYCPKDRVESALVWKQFLEKDKTHYLRYNNKDSKFEIVDIKGNILDNSEVRLRKQIQSFIEPNNEYIQESMKFFDYLMKVMPSHSVTEDDFEITFKNKFSKDTIEVNIIDIVYYVPRKKLDRPPPANVVAAFNILKKQYSIPNCMIGNKYFE